MQQLGQIQGICEANQRTLAKMDKLLHGNGEAPGLKGRVDRLEQMSKRLDWWYGAAVLALFAVVSTVAVWFLTNGPPAG